jgi:hypothetical protein
MGNPDYTKLVARGGLSHSAMLDPDFKYPPYSEHERMHGIIGKLMP